MKILLLFLLFVQCSSSSNKETCYDDYNLTNENKFEIVKLPSILKEISGISFLKDDIVICINDEQSILFEYDLQKEKITNEFKFSKSDGDYEAITHNANFIFILRSDGRLYQIDRLSNEVIKHKLFEKNVEAEGMCYNPYTDRLIVALKSKLKGDKKDSRSVFQFKIDENKIDENKIESKLLFKVSNEKISKYVATLNCIDFENKIAKFIDKKETIFWPSAIDIHPQDHYYTLLSAKNNWSLRMDEDGQILQMNWLDKKLLPQAEGLTFKADGTMIISTEGESNQKLVILK